MSRETGGPRYWKHKRLHGIQYAVEQLHFQSREQGLAWVKEYYPGEALDAIAGWADTAPAVEQNIWSDIPAPAPTVSGEAGEDEISPYEWLAQEFDRLAILRKMWTAHEVAAMIRRHDIERKPAPARGEVLEEQDMLEAGRKYEDNRKPDLIIRDEPFYSGAQLRAAYRHGYDFARALAEKP